MQGKVDRQMPPLGRSVVCRNIRKLVMWSVKTCTIPCKNFRTIRQHNVGFFLPILLQTITYISYDKGDFQLDRDIEPTEGRFIQLPSLRWSVYLHIVCFQKAHQSMVTVREGWLAKAFFPGKTKNTLSTAAGQIMTFRSRSS